MFEVRRAQCHCCRLPGTKAMTDLSQRRLAEALLILHLTGKVQETYVLATENDTLNGVSMLFGKLLTSALKFLQAFAHTGALKR